MIRTLIALALLALVLAPLVSLHLLGAIGHATPHGSAGLGLASPGLEPLLPIAHF